MERAEVWLEGRAHLETFVENEEHRQLGTAVKVVDKRLDVLQIVLGRDVEPQELPPIWRG